MNRAKLENPVIFETKYDIKNAKELEDKIQVKYDKDEKAKELLTKFPTVYIINSPIGKSGKFSVYVGETNDIQRRTIEHLGEDPKSRED
ncbi:MAG: ATP-dependent exonuclease, partial [Lactobacillaceae bacterium]